MERLLAGLVSLAIFTFLHHGSDARVQGPLVNKSLALGLKRGGGESNFFEICNLGPLWTLLKGKADPLNKSVTKRAESCRVPDYMAPPPTNLCPFCLFVHDGSFHLLSPAHLEYQGQPHSLQMSSPGLGK